MAIMPVKIFYQSFTTSKLDVLPPASTPFNVYRSYTCVLFRHCVHTTCKSVSLLSYKKKADKSRNTNSTSAFATFVL